MIFHPNTARIARDRLHWVVAYDRGYNNELRSDMHADNDPPWILGQADGLRNDYAIHHAEQRALNRATNVRRIRPGRFA